MEQFRDEQVYAIQKQKYLQYLFFTQWDGIRSYANTRGIKIIGDLPIFIAHDSADAWANQELFYLDAVGKPSVVAGVPPDYFSETGQLWGNPLYRWEKHAQEQFAWWMGRLRAAYKVADIIRLDHFRGFVDYWEIPAGEDTAVNGRWVPGPGADFLQRVKEELGSLPIIAEDLGEINPEVFVLRDQFNLPGMKILVFAFDSGESNIFLPHHYSENCIVYTGTHDNDTAVGWFKDAEEGERTFAQRYLDSSGDDIAWDLIKAAWGSRAVFAIAPLQDILSLDNSARMNYPGKPQGNWRWRFTATELKEDIKQRLAEVNYLYGRSKIGPMIDDGGPD
jgi:4-alpha-glucanotransferase